jgi:hypothetical protein
VTHNEYEKRRRRLDAQLQEGLQLLHAAHQAQVRALELVWISQGDAEPSAPPSSQDERSDSAGSAPIAPPSPRRKPDEVYEGVLQALQRLPEVFQRQDILEALGYNPDRTTLHRVLRELVRDGSLTVQDPGRGQRGTRYRKR